MGDKREGRDGRRGGVEGWGRRFDQLKSQNNSRQEKVLQSRSSGSRPLLHLVSLLKTFSVPTLDKPFLTLYKLSRLILSSCLTATEKLARSTESRAGKPVCTPNLNIHLSHLFGSSGPPQDKALPLADPPHPSQPLPSLPRHPTHHFLFYT